jgi:hypothetical protein
MKILLQANCTSFIVCCWTMVLWILCSTLHGQLHVLAWLRAFDALTAS